MKIQPRKATAWPPSIVSMISILLGIAGCILFFLNRETAVPSSWGTAGGSRNDLVAWFNMLQAALIVPLATSALGLLILRRRVAPRIGWLFLTLGLLSAGQSFLSEYAIEGAYTQATPLPGTGLAALVTNFTWIFLYGTMIYMLAIFPNGRFISPRFRTLFLILVGLFVMPLFLAAIIETPLSSAYQIDNPFVTKSPTRLYNGLFMIGVPAMPLMILALIMALVRRFRHSQGRDRQQMKWLLAGVVVQAILVLFGLILFMGLNVPTGGILVNVSVLGPLLGIGVALLRHKLYDIDIIIQRTVLYTAVSATLALTYFGSILLLQALFNRLVPPQSPLIVVTSTLITVALFSPLRRRLQRVIDRRFFRQKYDAQQVLAQFAHRLQNATVRDETDMEALQVELLRVVQETMQPEQISVWLKPVIQEKRPFS